MNFTQHNIPLEVAYATSRAVRSVQGVDLCAWVSTPIMRVLQSRSPIQSMNLVTHLVKGFAHSGGGSSG